MTSIDTRNALVRDAIDRVGLHSLSWISPADFNDLGEVSILNQANLAYDADRLIVVMGTKGRIYQIKERAAIQDTSLLEVYFLCELNLHSDYESTGKLVFACNAKSLIIGYIEQASLSRMSGWVKCPLSPDSLDVVLHQAGVILARAKADRPRKDLIEVGHFSDKHEFWLNLKDINLSANFSLSIRVEQLAEELRRTAYETHDINLHLTTVTKQHASQTLTADYNYIPDIQKRIPRGQIHCVLLLILSNEFTPRSIQLVNQISALNKLQGYKFDKYLIITKSSPPHLFVKLISSALGISYNSLGRVCTVLELKIMMLSMPKATKWVALDLNAMPRHNVILELCNECLQGSGSQMTVDANDSLPSYFLGESRHILPFIQKRLELDPTYEASNLNESSNRFKYENDVCVLIVPETISNLYQSWWMDLCLSKRCARSFVITVGDHRMQIYTSGVKIRRVQAYQQICDCIHLTLVELGATIVVIFSDRSDFLPDLIESNLYKKYRFDLISKPVCKKLESLYDELVNGRLYLNVLVPLGFPIVSSTQQRCYNALAQHSSMPTLVAIFDDEDIFYQVKQKLSDHSISWLVAPGSISDVRISNVREFNSLDDALFAMPSFAISLSKTLDATHQLLCREIITLTCELDICDGMTSPLLINSASIDDLCQRTEFLINTFGIISSMKRDYEDFRRNFVDVYNGYFKEIIFGASKKSKRQG